MAEWEKINLKVQSDEIIWKEDTMKIKNIEVMKLKFKCRRYGCPWIIYNFLLSLSLSTKWDFDTPALPIDNSSKDINISIHGVFKLKLLK